MSFCAFWLGSPIFLFALYCYAVTNVEGPRHLDPSSESFCTELYGVTGVGAPFGVLRYPLMLFLPAVKTTTS